VKTEERIKNIYNPRKARKEIYTAETGTGRETQTG